MFITNKFAKKLKENGCELESELFRNSKTAKLTKKVNRRKIVDYIDEGSNQQEEVHYYNNYPAYDILNDICVKYAKEFFGEDYHILTAGIKLILPPPMEVLAMLQQSKPQEEIEKYIWDNCKFKN